MGSCFFGQILLAHVIFYFLFGCVRYHNPTLTKVKLKWFEEFTV